MTRLTRPVESRDIRCATFGQGAWYVRIVGRVGRALREKTRSLGAHIAATPPAEILRKIAVLGNYAPRQCGIATFTTDLRNSLATALPDADCFALAMNDGGRRHAYPVHVRFELAENEIAGYRRAADFLNVNSVDIVCVQHEYGIFGGNAGSHVLALLRELRMPIVTTLHTLLAQPNLPQRRVMDELTELSTRLVVMSRRAAELLREVHGVPSRRIDVIPRGIVDVPVQGDAKGRLGLAGKSVILTFGLLSPDKGIEQVIEAMPAILARFPNAVYVVLGATHPQEKEHSGETYRRMLQSRGESLGVDSSVVFADRFVSTSELGEYFAAADICVTPYLEPERSTSGTLAYAVASGKAVISTPYSYATELLEDGRGILVPWRDSEAIAREVIGLLSDDSVRLGFCDRARAYGHSMVWPYAALRYIQSFERACAEHAKQLRTVFHAKTMTWRSAELPHINLEHLMLMTDDTGILQHGAFNVPRYSEGYCLDDNARALMLMALLEGAEVENARSRRVLASRYLAFLNHAYDQETRRFRNFMSYTRRWLEECGSEDSHGRALWALGTVVGRSADPAKQSLAGSLFHGALPCVSGFTSPRAWAFALLGVNEYLRAFEGDSSVEATRRTLAEQLLDLFRCNGQRDWPWLEDRVTYCNARLSQALITSGYWIDHEEMIGVGLRSLDWLAAIQRSTEGYFAPVGTDGFYRRGEPMPRFDQQPVEACAMVSACLEAQRVTGDVRWLDHARRAFDWFLGQNERRQALYDSATGGCRDGLRADRVNENQGAESTISFLLALCEMTNLDRVQSTTAAVRERAP